ncbi:MAG: type II toxin-antitoxin system RelE/ParE family toxin [Candidatus Eisenbacteria bacterium]|nr:type II toxin-antitoxin system RelE/ParE family toxin [Candidatus Eisenbacteria bacterium]
MEIVETSIFTKQVTAILSNDEYQQLQSELIMNPCLGPLIRGGGGLRKVRWSLPGRGKSAGARAIYYWAVNDEIILMLFLYKKNEQEDLTPTQIKTLRRIIEEEYP